MHSKRFKYALHCALALRRGEGERGRERQGGRKGGREGGREREREINTHMISSTTSFSCFVHRE